MSHDFIQIIEERGFVHQFTDRKGLSDLLASGPQTAYIGFDCTAKSLHVGSLLQIMLLRWWQKCGHRPIVLLGGGTTKIGDPSGKDESRPPLTDAQINENMNSLKQVFSKFIEFGDDKALMVNNDDWLKDLNYAQFLRDYGRHFSINRMLTMDSVKLRLEREQTLSFLEFNYMILQAYDFVELNKKHACTVQLGGSDQWGNIINGVELHHHYAPFDVTGKIQKQYTIEGISDAKEFTPLDKVKERCPELQSKKLISAVHLGDKKILIINYRDELFGITSPLLTTASGAKMGKTAAGAVWLNADLLKPYDYWQYWRNTEDADVVKFLKLFTELSLDDIAKLAKLEGAEINEAKKILATEATAMLHGRAEAEKAAQTAADTFAGSGVSADLPEITVTSPDVSVLELLVKAGFATSNGEAKRAIQGNGISLNDAKVTDEKHRLTQADFAQGFAKLSKGKKQHVLVKLA